METIENPYVSPLMPPERRRSDARVLAWRKLSAPAVLMIAGSSILMLSIITGLLRESFVGAAGPDRDSAQRYTVTDSLTFIYVPLAISVVGIYGGIQMLRMRQYVACVAASLMVVIPTMPCIFVLSVVGIWALVVLLRKETRAALAQINQPTNHHPPPPYPVNPVHPVEKK